MKTLLTLVLLTLSLAVNASSYLPLPTNSIILTEFSSTWNFSELCTPGSTNDGCGTVHPQYQNIASTYDWYGNAWNPANTWAMGRLNLSIQGPVYHVTCTVFDQLWVTNGVVFPGSYENETCNYGSGNVVVYSNAITGSFDVGASATKGQVSCSYITTDGVLSWTYLLTNSSTTKIRFAGGNSKYVYHYRIYFTATEMRGCPQPGYQLDDWGPVACSVPGHTCYQASDESYYFDYYYTGATPVLLDVTPYANVPFYRYYIEPPVFIDASQI